MAQNALPHANKSTNVRSLVTQSVAWLGRRAPSLGARAAERLFLTPARHTRPAWERAILADARRFRLRYGKLTLPAWSWGEGPTVLLLHGWEGRGSQLGRFVAPLVASGHRVVTFDFPGHGAAPDAHVSVVEFARVLTAVHGQLGPLESIIAHSVGGAAAAFALRDAHFATRLVTLGSPRGPRRFFDGFARALGLDDETRRATEARLEARYGMPLDAIDAAHFAHDVHAEVLVIHDRDDREVPFDHGGALVAHLPHATLHATSGLGHRRILRDEGVIARAVAFAASPRATPLATKLDRELYGREERVA